MGVGYQNTGAFFPVVVTAIFDELRANAVAFLLLFRAQVCVSFELGVLLDFGIFGCVSFCLF